MQKRYCRFLAYKQKAPQKDCEMPFAIRSLNLSQFFFLIRTIADLCVYHIFRAEPLLFAQATFYKLMDYPTENENVHFISSLSLITLSWIGYSLSLGRFLAVNFPVFSLLIPLPHQRH